MGHATHFLERLERLSSPQADFALELYRDSALIRFVLERSRLPDRAERVALGVDQQPGGPHIIVTRDGAFVTCLGAGMSTKDLPVIKRGQIEHLGSEFEGLREATARSRDRAETRRLFRNVMQNGPALSQEDFSALAAMMPILNTACGRAAAETANYLMRFERRYTRGRYRRLSDKVVSELRHYWASQWAMGHLVALCGTRSSEVASTIAKTSEEETFVSYTMSRMTMYSMNLPVMLRGGWAAARVGRSLVSAAKDNLRRAENFIDMVSNALPLVIIALRHRGARAEVQKVLARTRRRVAETMCSRFDHMMSEPLLEILEKVFDPKVETTKALLYRGLGAAYVEYIAKHLPEDHPHRYASHDEMPDELVYALPMCLDENILGGAESLVILTTMLPWLAGADAADFYVPSHLLSTYVTEWEPERTLAHLDFQHRYYMRDRPVRARSKVGRNEPCPCGSGNKYKRCCGA